MSHKFEGYSLGGRSLDIFPLKIEKYSGYEGVQNDHLSSSGSHLGTSPLIQI